MKNKKSLNSTTLVILFALIIIGIIIFTTFTYSDLNNLDSIFDESITFTQERINKYKNYINNDQAKSLSRLSDKAEALSFTMNNDSDFNQDKLQEYADEQSLSGIFVLNENLELTMKTSDASIDSWQDIIGSSYVKDIVDYPSKIYVTRFSLNEDTYDFAAVSRKDDKGLIITYVKKNEMAEKNGDISIESLLLDFPFEKNGVVAICEDGNIVGSNKADLLGKSSLEWHEIFKSIQEDESITTVNFEGTKWYGRRAASDKYNVYMFFPSSNVFTTRNVIVMVYVLVALLILLISIIARSRQEKNRLETEQKRLNIINAIGQAYSSIYLGYIKTQKLEAIKGFEANDDGGHIGRLSAKEKEDYLNNFIAEPYRKGFFEFVNLDTVEDRLKNERFISYTCQKSDGTWMLSLIVPQKYDKNGNLEAILLANRDVTEEKVKEITQQDALANALVAAQQANRAKTTFLNNMSHDIRTPMNAIIGFTALAQTHIDNKAEVEDYLAKISTSSTHLLSLINDILDMSRIESGTVKLDENTVHIPDLLHDLRTMIQGLINAKSLNLFIDTQDVKHEDVITDKLRLNQVLINIVGNAIKFTQPGGDIIIRLIEKPCSMKGYTTYEFSVKDSGVGMSQEFIGHIFDTFSREHTSTVSGIQGTGLGMAITKNIVDMMGGDIKVESEVGKGSKFTVILNLKLTDKTIDYEPIPELLGARALVVDDDMDTCRSVSKMLRDIDMRPDWTTSGKEAIVHAQDAVDSKDEYKAYIIDYLMPDMNGIETVRRIRKIIGEDAAIIVLTAYDWADLENEAREAGVTAFVSKPIFMSELRSVLTKPTLKDNSNKNEEKKAYDFSGKKALVVEDNELNRQIAKAILEETGMEIDTVNDGDEAVSCINNAPADKYDLIFMDIQMPRMDGYTATREIRTLPDNKKANIPIVAMTANAFEEDKKKAYESGMNGHIIKPISIEAIAKVLDEIFK